MYTNSRPYLTTQRAWPELPGEEKVYRCQMKQSAVGSKYDVRKEYPANHIVNRTNPKHSYSHSSPDRSSSRPPSFRSISSNSSFPEGKFVCGTELERARLEKELMFEEQKQKRLEEKERLEAEERSRILEEAINRLGEQGIIKLLGKERRRIAAEERKRMLRKDRNRMLAEARAEYDRQVFLLVVGLAALFYFLTSTPGWGCVLAAVISFMLATKS
jgi:hypothetical protein